jgi:hypothetical protein
MARVTPITPAAAIPPTINCAHKGIALRLPSLAFRQAYTLLHPSSTPASEIRVAPYKAAQRPSIWLAFVSFLAGFGAKLVLLGREETAYGRRTCKRIKGHDWSNPSP